MERLSIGRWTLLCDAEATRRAFEGVPVGSPESCGCADCSNFAAARAEAYPPAALSLFARLGIDPRKESEIWRTHRDERGLHHYGGFFHFVGLVESGPDAKRREGAVATFDLEPAGEQFSFGFTSDAALVPESFAGLRVAQLEFQTTAPWVSGAPESE